MINWKTGSQMSKRIRGGVCLFFMLGALSACTSSGTSAIDVTGSIPPAPPAEIASTVSDIIQEPAPQTASLQTEPLQTESFAPQEKTRRASTIERPAKLHPKFGDHKPFEFPYRQPTDYAVHGTDTSRWQPEIHWGKVQNAGDRKSTRLNSSHRNTSRMPSSA